MQYLATTGTAGVIEINGTVIVELLTFLIMLAVLARYVYPEVVKIAETRQRAIAQQLHDAEQARVEAEARLKEAQAKLDEARKTAQQVIDSASKSGEQLRQDLREKAEEDARRIAESARREIEAERERALQSARTEVAALVVTATEKVIGETLDGPKHRKLIEQAIEEVASGDGSR
jgi:F-type H+-transporting ATPase subunit b